MSETRPTVVLLHGLARRASSLVGLRRALERAGYPTWSVTYPSRRQTIVEAAAAITERLVVELPGQPLCAVTHSLGGIVVRHMHDPRLAWRRIVMLAPPNRGSQVAAAFADNPLFRWFYGPSGQEVARPPVWPLPPAPFAVIAGTHGDALSNPASWLPHRIFPAGEAHDGTVSVAETKLDEMAAFHTAPATHTWIMNHPDVQAHILAFLGASEGG